MKLTIIRDFYFGHWIINSSMNYCLIIDDKNSYINYILAYRISCSKNNRLIDSSSHIVMN